MRARSSDLSISAGRAGAGLGGWLEAAVRVGGSSAAGRGCVGAVGGAGCGGAGSGALVGWWAVRGSGWRVCGFPASFGLWYEP